MSGAGDTATTALRGAWRARDDYLTAQMALGALAGCLCVLGQLYAGHGNHPAIAPLIADAAAHGNAMHSGMQEIAARLGAAMEQAKADAAHGGQEGER
jgi:hypothetical protein